LRFSVADPKKQNDQKKKSAEAAHIHQKFMIDFIQFEN
jgi:hypothetical protein